MADIKAGKSDATSPMATPQSDEVGEASAALNDVTGVNDVGAAEETDPLAPSVTHPIPDAEDGDLSTFQNIGQAPLLPPREPLGARLATVMGRHHALLFTLCVLLLWGITTWPSALLGEALQRGQVAPHDITASHDAVIPLLDPAEIAARREEAANLVPPVYNPNPAAQSQALEDLYAIVTAARHAITRTVVPANVLGRLQPHPVPPHPVPPQVQAQQLEMARLARFNAELKKPIPVHLALQILRVPVSRWELIEGTAANAVRAVYKGGQLRSDVMQEDLVTASARIDRQIHRELHDKAVGSNTQIKLTPADAAIANALAHQVAHEPNLLVDERKTARDREQAQNSVRDLYQRIKADTPIVKAGEVITDEKWSQLQAMSLVSPRVDFKTALAKLALCLALVTFAASYITHFHRTLLDRPAALWLAAMVPVAFLAIFRQSLRVPHADLSMVPLAATAAMLLTILLNARVGIVVGFLVSSLCALMAHADISLFLVTALSAWIGVLSVAEISSRGQLMVRAPIVLALANGVLAASWGTLRDAPSDEILSIAFWGGLAGIFSVVATAALAMSLERPFGITTHLRLLELLAPDELVMRRMQAEAPGTYTHSLMVASLSEAAAKAVGADPLLCRVSGLYHDIGKLRRPHCFVENQSGENIHDKLSPQLSALIILAHVKDGIELGRALRLPQPVTDIIAQHHGTTLISYFYQRALTQCGAKNCAEKGIISTSPSNGTASANALPNEASFRYAGPRPQTKEAAIVLLADTIEASARSLPNLTQERLESHIKTMIDQRLQEGELSECELTLRDLGIVESSFIHVLRGVLHQRIAYPEPGTDFGAEDKEDARGWMRDTLATEGSRQGQPGFIERRGGVRADRRQQNAANEPRRREKNKQGHKSKAAPHAASATQTDQANEQLNGIKVAKGAHQGHNTHSNGRQDHNGRSDSHLKEAYDSSTEAASAGTFHNAIRTGDITPGKAGATHQESEASAAQSQGECNLDTNGTGFAMVNGEPSQPTNGHPTPHANGHAVNGQTNNGHAANGHSTNGHSTNGHANGRLRSQHANGRDSHTNGTVTNGTPKLDATEANTESAPEHSRA